LFSSSTHPAPSALYTLSLHDALPILPVDLHLGPMVDPLQRALVRQARAILIHLPGGNHVRSERFVLVAGWGILVAGAGRIIDATAARHLEGCTLELLEVK